MEMATRRQKILETGLQLFSRKTIAAVTMNNVADACGIGIATLYRYYRSKPELVMAIANWVWDDYVNKNAQIINDPEKDSLSAIERYGFFIDTFIDLYRNQKDMLRFNQMFNIYVRSEMVPQDQIKAYTDMINALSVRFQEMVLRGQQDGTIRNDVSGQTIFSSTLHIMLAVTTRYAFGLVYTPEGEEEAERELQLLKRMLISETEVKVKCNFSPPEPKKW